MQGEVVEGLVSALEDSGLGLAVQLASVEREAGDPAPGTPLIVDALHDETTAKGEQFDRGADLLVVLVPAGPTRYDASNAGLDYANGLVPIQLLVYDRDEALTADVRIRRLQYAMRAIVHVFAAYFGDRRRDRSTRGVTLLGITSLAAGLAQDDGGGACGAVEFSVKALDKRAKDLSH